MNALLKTACLAVYALALAGLPGPLPPGTSGPGPNIALRFLGVHAMEIVVMFKQVRLYRGPLVVSMLLTLLFGLLHWKPLADEQKRAAGR